MSGQQGERIAKVMARAGIASRRQAEEMIAAGRVSVNGKAISSPALNVTASDEISVDGMPLPQRERTRVFRFHKPRDLVTTHSDPQGRPTIFGALPKNLPRLISVGRLDINTEGLLLLTNDGELARMLELPQTGWLRTYRVRALGRVTQDALDKLKGGISIKGVHYGPIEATFDREQGANVWLTIGIREGKNREVRNVMEHLGVKVNRLLRVSFGPFELGDLERGEVREVPTDELRRALGTNVISGANVDFEGPVLEREVSQRKSRHPEERAKRASKGDGPGRSSFEGRASARPPQDDGKRRHRRRDRSGGPRPSRPRPKDER